MFSANGVERAINVLNRYKPGTNQSDRETIQLSILLAPPVVKAVLNGLPALAFLETFADRSPIPPQVLLHESLVAPSQRTNNICHECPPLSPLEG